MPRILQFQYNSVNPSILLLLFLGDHVGCSSQNCALGRTSHDRYFCCCYGDLCNVRFVVFPSNDTDTVTSTLALSSIQPESTSLFMSSSLYSSSTAIPSGKVRLHDIERFCGPKFFCTFCWICENCV